VGVHNQLSNHLVKIVNGDSSCLEQNIWFVFDSKVLELIEDERFFDLDGWNKITKDTAKDFQFNKTVGLYGIRICSDDGKEWIHIGLAAGQEGFKRRVFIEHSNADYRARNPTKALYKV